MRKGQKRLLEKAEKYGFSEEQIEYLQNESLKMSTLTELFRIFRAIEDFPLAEALKYVEQYKGDAYALCWTPRLRYSQYLSFPDIFKENPKMLYPLRFIYKSLTKTMRPEKTAEYVIKKASAVPDSEKAELLEAMETLVSRIMVWNERHRSPRISQENLDYIIEFCVHIRELSCKNMASIRNKMIKDREKRLKESLKDNLENPFNEWMNKQIKKEIDELKNNTTVPFCKIIDYISGQMNIKALINQTENPRKAAEILFNSKLRREYIKKYEEFKNLFGHLLDKESNTVYDFQSDKQKADILYILNNTDIDATIGLKCHNISISFSQAREDASLFIRLMNSNSARIYTSHDGRRMCGLFDKKFASDFIVYGGGHIYKKTGKVFRPALVREVISAFRYHKADNLLDEIMKIPAVSDSHVFRDMFCDYDEAVSKGLTFPSFKWNDCIGVHNRNQFMQKVYRKAGDINFNRLGLNRGYAYMKTLPFVDEKSKNILYNAITNAEIEGFSGFARGNNVANLVLSRFLIDRIIKNKTGNTVRKEENIANIINAGIQVYHDRDEDLSQIETEIRDYVNNSIRNKVPVNLAYKSVKKIITKNVDIVLERANKSTPKVIISKNSKYISLSENLPECFEWIRTRQRIIAEGQLMRHCVASYADKVNNDRCAIYHLYFDGKNYTIEFCINNGKYDVIQIQSKADRGAPHEVWKYVRDTIAGINPCKAA